MQKSVLILWGPLHVITRRHNYRRVGCVHVKNPSVSDVSNEIIRVSLEILNNFLRIPYDENDTDAKALRGLVIRTLDDIRGCRVLAEKELGTQVLSLSRDFVEIELLIIYFRIHPGEIGTWYNASQTKREKKI